MKKTTQPKKRWLYGGMRAVVICIVLGIFYLTIYFPAIKALSKDGLPNGSMILPTITGHAFPLLSHFVIPHGWMCEATEPVCVMWSIDSAPDSIPWVMDGNPGYCHEQIMQPTSECDERSEKVGAIGLWLMLLIIYFIIGAITIKK
ncbi:hypothetical protein IPJ72_03435 [Candidatus Peregrinibacteria bacterium]|nr:MAG: hypothetical protein IPJ72_03435 [Candidatus Peregrinibacteria bacterium]